MTTMLEGREGIGPGDWIEIRSGRNGIFPRVWRGAGTPGQIIMLEVVVPAHDQNVMRVITAHGPTGIVRGMGSISIPVGVS